MIEYNIWSLLLTLLAILAVGAWAWLRGYHRGVDRAGAFYQAEIKKMLAGAGVGPHRVGRWVPEDEPVAPEWGHHVCTWTGTEKTGPR